MKAAYYLMFWAWAWHILPAMAVTPTAIIQMKKTFKTLYAAPGTFGSDISSEQTAAPRKLILPTNDADGCDPQIPAIPRNSAYFLMVSRGNCSFTDKAMAAELVGARGIIVYNSFEGIYQGNSYASSIDYDCDNGVGYLDPDEVTYPVWDIDNDDLPTECTKSDKCSSKKCLITNITNSYGVKVCCAWDLYLTMGSSGDDDTSEISIQAAFITMADSDTLFAMSELELNSLEVFLYSRPSSIVDLATVVVWAIAIFTVYLGARKAIDDDKDEYYSYDFKKASNVDTEYGIRQRQRTIEPLNDQDVSDSDDEIGNPANEGDYQYGSIVDSQCSHPENKSSSNNMDMTVSQAILFIFLASCFLILLYFVDLYAFVSIIYLCAAAFAIALVTFEPMYLSFFGHESESRSSTSNCVWYLSLLSGFALSVCWYYYKTESTWIWVVQDLLGVNVCVLFLTTIRVPNLKTAAILLGLAFFYDVFFVFISPYVFSSSVMLSVAESSTSSSVSHPEDENYCEKYPDSSDCQSSTLPMLLIVPTVTSFTSTATILGLGDIILPGLLIVWAARLDIRRVGYLENLEFGTSYFYPALVAYAVGLLLANIAVGVFDSGQPALLYIVPLTLGVVISRASEFGSLELLWEDLPPMKTVARPVGFEEQEALLYRAAVVEAEASLFSSRLHTGTADVVVISADNITSTGSKTSTRRKQRKEYSNNNLRQNPNPNSILLDTDTNASIPERSPDIRTDTNNSNV